MTHLKFEAHADISHNELVLLQVDAKLVKGEVDARGGVIAGSILIEDTQAHGMYVRCIATPTFSISFRNVINLLT